MTETTYFSDPQLDRAASLIFELAAQLHVTRNRVRVLEQVLQRRGLLDAGEVDGFVPDQAEQAVLDDQRDQLLRGLVRILTEDGPAAHPLRDEVARVAAP